MKRFTSPRTPPGYQVAVGPVVDCHQHLWPEAFIDELRRRSRGPRLAGLGPAPGRRADLRRRPGRPRPRRPARDRRRRRHRPHAAVALQPARHRDDGRPTRPRRCSTRGTAWPTTSSAATSTGTPSGRPSTWSSPTWPRSPRPSSTRGCAACRSRRPRWRPGRAGAAGAGAGRRRGGRPAGAGAPRPGRRRPPTGCPAGGRRSRRTPPSSRRRGSPGTSPVARCCRGCGSRSSASPGWRRCTTSGSPSAAAPSVRSTRWCTTRPRRTGCARSTPLIRVVGIDPIVHGSDRPYALPTDPGLGAAFSQSLFVTNPAHLMNGAPR